VLVVLLAAAAHHDQVAAVGGDHGRASTAVGLDEEAAGGAEAEDGDHGFVELVGRAVGVRRISVGQAIAQAAYSFARRAAAEVVGKGTFDVLADADPFGDVNGAFRPRPLSDS